MDAAQEFAAKARENSDKSLAELAADNNAIITVSTEKFSWLNIPRNFRSMSLTLSEVREKDVPYGEAFRKNKALIAPGPQFFETAFGLEKGEIGVSFNQPEDRVFVIKITERDTDDMIIKQFDQIGDDQFGLQALQYVKQDMNHQFREDWIKELRDNAGFEWVSIPRDTTR